MPCYPVLHSHGMTSEQTGHNIGIHVSTLYGTHMVAILLPTGGDMIAVIRIHDKSADPLATKAGDIITIVPDGWVFSPAEIGNPDYRFIQVPLTTLEVNALTGQDINPITRRLVRARKYAVDISALAQLAPHTIHKLTRAELKATVKP